MVKFALYDYIPERYLKRASFEDMETHRRILDFKDGRIITNSETLTRYNEDEEDDGEHQ